MLSANVNYKTTIKLLLQRHYKAYCQFARYPYSQKERLCRSHRLCYNEDFTQINFLCNIATLGNSDASF